jgi:hypothetical protein
MSDFDFRSRIHPHEQEEPVADDARSQSQVEAAPVAAGWSPDGPTPPPSSGQLPGLMTSAGAEQHPEMVWRQSPSLIDFDVKSLEAEKLLKDFPAQQGRGPLKSVYEDMKAGRGDPSAREPTGAVADGVDQYAAATRKLEKNWQHLDPDAAADSLRQSGSNLLARDHMPALRPNIGDVPDGAQAAFNHADRAVKVHPTAFRSASDVDGLAVNMYHEVEHAHQWGSVERLANGAPMSAEEQQSALRMKDDLVDHAGEHARIEQLTPEINTAGDEAYGTFNHMRPDDQMLAAGSWADLRARMVDANDTYYKLPSEQDAYATEKRLKDKLGQK